VIRQDLTEEIRFEIAYLAYQAQQSKDTEITIVKLAQEYKKINETK